MMLFFTDSLLQPNEGGIVIVDRQGPFSIILISQNIEDDSVPVPSFIKLCGPPVTGEQYK